MEGMSLSDYLIREIRELAQRPTLAEFREMLHRQEPLTVEIDSAKLIRDERDSR